MNDKTSAKSRKSVWAGTAAASVIILSGAFMTAAASANDGGKGEASGGEDRIPVDFLATPFEPSEAQRQLLQGGVTREDYLSAFENYMQCMDQADHPLVGVKVESEIIEYSITDSAVQAGVHQSCYPSEFYQVDLEWQIELERKRS